MILNNEALISLEEREVEIGFSWATVKTIMKEVERLTKAEVEDQISNRMDDWTQSIVHGTK